MQENQDSIPPQTQLEATTAVGTSNGRTTRNSATNKTQTGQNKGGDTTVSFTTTKALRDAATKKERMRHKPEELDIVEWHYLVLYFGKTSFQV